MKSSHHITQTFCMALAIAWLPAVGKAAVSAEKLANILAQDSGRPAATLAAYAEKLAETLNELPTAKLEEVMEPEDVAEISDGNTENPIPNESTLGDSLQQAFDSAVQTFQQVSQDLTDAQAHWESVLRDDAGLNSDGIPGNYWQAKQQAQSQLTQAQAAYNSALDAVNEAQNELTGYNGNLDDDESDDD